MSILKLKAETREEVGSRASVRIRDGGYIPANLYSHGDPSTPLKLQMNLWSKALAEEFNLVTLQLPGREQLATVKEIQREPLSQRIIHIDLQGIKMDEPIEFSVKIEFTGTPKGLKGGGVLSISSDHVNVLSLPKDLPDHLTCEISHLDIGQSISARDLALPEEITLVSDPALTLASVLLVRIVVEEPEKPVVGEEGAVGEAAGEKESEDKDSSD